MPTVHIVVKGKVQGVFYRASAKKYARELKITGWIRNTEEGDVEAMITGTKEQLKKFSDWCSRGPKDAVVNMLIEKEQPETIFDSFIIMH